MRVTFTQKWLVTVLVTLALLASPCLSLSLMMGSGPAQAFVDERATHQQSHHDHGDAGSAAQHKHENGDGQPPQNCCKLCDAWLSGRKNDTDKALIVRIDHEPPLKLSAIIAPVPAPGHASLKMVITGANSTSADDAAPTPPLYLTTGRFRI